MDVARTGALIHVIWTFLVPLYPLFVPAEWGLDIYFIVYILLLNLSWTLMNGECAVTLFYAGEGGVRVRERERDPTNMVDFYQIIPRDLYDNYLFYVLVGMQTVATWVVFSRNQDIIGLGWTFALILATMGYLYVLRRGGEKVVVAYTEVYKLGLVWVIAQLKK